MEHGIAFSLWLSSTFSVVSFRSSVVRGRLSTSTRNIECWSKPTLSVLGSRFSVSHRRNAKLFFAFMEDVITLCLLFSAHRDLLTVLGFRSFNAFYKSSEHLLDLHNTGFKILEGTLVDIFQISCKYKEIFEFTS